jgi:hypothetical protein
MEPDEVVAELRWTFHGSGVDFDWNTSLDEQDEEVLLREMARRLIAYADGFDVEPVVPLTEGWQQQEAVPPPPEHRTGLLDRDAAGPDRRGHR